MTTPSPSHDLVLTGGTLLDPAQGIHDRRDIAFKDGLVSQVAEHIDPASAATSVDVSGKVITPGLIDLHGHFYHGGNGTAVLGGFEHKGWPLNKNVDSAEIAAAASRVAGVAKINEIFLGDNTGTVSTPVEIQGLDLPRLLGLEVVAGTAPGIEEIQGRQPPSGGDDPAPLPVPIVPAEC